MSSILEVPCVNTAMIRFGHSQVGSSQPPETALTSAVFMRAQGFYVCKQPGQLKGLAPTLLAPGHVPPLALLRHPYSAFQQPGPAPPSSACPLLARH